MDKKSFKKSLIVCGLFALLAVAFTVIVKKIGVGTVGPENSAVGLASVNQAAAKALGSSDLWYKITKYSGYLLFLPVAFYAILGVVQLFKRKSFKKVDRELKILALFYLAVAATYLFFEKVLVINYRPVLMDGALEPSYPSSHTLFAITICSSAMLLTKKYLKLKYANLVNFFLAILMLVTVIGRLLSGVHWLTDIMGGLFIGAFLFMAFYTALKAKPAKKEPKAE